MSQRKKLILSLMLPTVIYIAIFVIFPLIYSLITSMRVWYVMRPDIERTFVWLKNYGKNLTDPYFYKSLWATVYLSFSFVLIEFWVGLLIALLMKKFSNIERLFTSLFILPTMMTPVIIALQWRFFLDSDYGLVNWFLMTIGLIKTNITWLSTYPAVIFSLILVDVWHWTPLLYLILLAGLKSLPPEPVEAAKIDGASGFQILGRIYLPMLKPIVAIGILVRFITAFLFFDEIFILTRGGPGVKTEVLSYHIYKMGFRHWDMGKGASASWLFLIIVEIICILFLRTLSEREMVKKRVKV
jgi:multiple sugar transport system permease protein